MCKAAALVLVFHLICFFNKNTHTQPNQPKTPNHEGIRESGDTKCVKVILTGSSFSMTEYS